MHSLCESCKLRFELFRNLKIKNQQVSNWAFVIYAIEDLKNT